MIAALRASRARSQFSIEYVVDFLIKARALVGNDFDAITILLVIMTQTTARAFRLDHEKVFGMTWEEQISRESVVPISRLAISSITGLPKETVRRKVAVLEEIGLIVRTGSRGVVLSEHLQTDSKLIDLINHNEKLLDRLASKLAEIKIFEMNTIEFAEEALTR